MQTEREIDLNFIDYSMPTQLSGVGKIGQGAYLSFSDQTQMKVTIGAEIVDLDQENERIALQLRIEERAKADWFGLEFDLSGREEKIILDWRVYPSEPIFPCFFYRYEGKDYQVQLGGFPTRDVFHRWSLPLRDFYNWMHVPKEAVTNLRLGILFSFAEWSAISLASAKFVETNEG